MSSRAPERRDAAAGGPAPPAKLAVITSHPIQYQVPLWRHLSQARGVNLEVLYPSLEGAEPAFDPGFGRVIQWDGSLLEGYPWSSVPNRPWPRLNWRFRYCVPGLVNRLRSGGFTHVLIVGKEFAYYHQALLAAKRLGLRVLYRAESHPAKNGRLAGALARTSRRLWYRRLDAFLCVGRYQYAEYAAYGVPADRMFFSPYGVDNAFFDAQRRACLDKRDALRRAYGFSPEAFVVGYAGKLYDRKNPLELFGAFERLRNSGRRYGLLVVGDGPLRGECERFAKRLAPHEVAFAGFLNQGELGPAYVAMDAFVIPSRWETWGLVLNEAMVFRLPVIATADVPAARDLIAEGRNGFTYPSGDVDALADRVAAVARRVAAGEPMGEGSWQTVREYSIEAAGQGILEAIRATGPAPAGGEKGDMTERAQP